MKKMIFLGYATLVSKKTNKPFCMGHFSRENSSDTFNGCMVFTEFIPLADDSRYGALLGKSVEFEYGMNDFGKPQIVNLKEVK